MTWTSVGCGRSILVKVAPQQVNATEAILAQVTPAQLAAKRASTTKILPSFFYSGHGRDLADSESAMWRLMRELSQRASRYRPIGHSHFVA